MCKTSSVKYFRQICVHREFFLFFLLVESHGEAKGLNKINTCRFRKYYLYLLLYLFLYKHLLNIILFTITYCNNFYKIYNFTSTHLLTLIQLLEKIFPENMNFLLDISQREINSTLLQNV